MIKDFFKEAFRLAEQAIEENRGGPFGAVIVCDNQIIGRGMNTVLRDHDPTAHAEINAIRDAARQIANHDLGRCFLVTTSEPCPMCLMAAAWSGVQKIYYAAPHSLADQYGFRDQKLAESISGRPVETIEVAEFGLRAKEIFETWKKQGGQIY